MADRGLSSEAFTLNKNLFWGGVSFYILVAGGGLVADGFPGWSVDIAFDFLNLVVALFVVAGLRLRWWTIPRAAAIMLYSGGLTFLCLAANEVCFGTGAADLALYDNLFILSLFMAPAVFLAGRWAAFTFGTGILTLMIVVSFFGLAPRMASHLWFEVPELLGVVFMLYHYRIGLDAVLDDLHTTVRENQALRDRERLASLGELAAGIAHEIQNPLNFVVNFAESSQGLLDDLEAASPEERQALVAELRANLTEIQTQGQRGAGIVRSMLRTARSSSDERLVVDLNTLVAECVHLAWLSQRSKPNGASVNREVVPWPEPARVWGSPVDLTRAFVNLSTNALQSLAAKAGRSGPDYRPLLNVTVEVRGSEVVISFADNGLGFDSHQKDQLFVPFYTTKGSGEGTGLGLSLTQDAVIQQGGRIEADGDRRTGAVFRVILPAVGGPP